MIGKEDDQYYYQGKEFFAGMLLDFHFVNAVLTFAHHMNESGNKLPCDEALVDAYRENRIVPQLIQWYLRTRRIVIDEIRVNFDGSFDFKVAQIEMPLLHPEPDF